jgi:predicted TPR repeat methyltransferase
MTTHDHHDGFLGAVYGATNTSDLARHYDGWAKTYDTEMARAGYRHPSIGLALLARHLPRGAVPLLDAGAGTGLLGEWLGILGYPHVEALDISEGMLAVAAQKGCYTALHRAALGGPLPFPDNHFAGITAVGVFSTGHVGVEGLAELLRVCQPGGFIVLTVKNALWDKGFHAHLEGLVAAQRLMIAEETAPYVSMPGEAGTSPSRALALRILS